MRFLTVLVFLVGAVPATAQTIPVEIEQNQVIATVTVGTSGPLHFLVDTGAQQTVIAADRVAEAGLAGGQAAKGSAQGGEIDAAVFDQVPVRVAGRSLGRMTVAAVDLAGLSAGTGRRIDGILGPEFFRGHVVRIDYARRAITLLPPGTRARGGVVLPLEVRDGVPFVTLRMTRGGTNASGRMLVDIGAVGAVTLTAPFVAAHPALVPDKTIALVSGAILPGKFVTRVGRLDRTGAGGFVIRDALTNFSANAAADDAAEGDAGLIGGYVLSRYVVTLDYAGKRMTLAPGAEVNAPYDFDASGLSLVAAAPDFRAKSVRLVLPDTPAAQAGIVKGDVLTAIDGTPVADIPLARLRAMLRRPGIAHRLDLTRDGRVLSVTLTRGG